MSRISIVIPTHNRLDVLPRAIQSARSQTIGICEIVVVDDASTDGTAAFVKANYPEINLVQLTKRSGGAVARNAGISVAKGEFLAFLDSDDYFLPTKLEEQLQEMAASHAAFSTTGYMTSEGRSMFLEPVASRRQLLKGNSLGGCTGLLVEANLIREHPFDPEMRAVQDWELFLRLSEMARFVHVPNALYVYETGRADQMTKQRRRRLAGHLRLYRKHIQNCRYSSASAVLSHRAIHGILKADIRGNRLQNFVSRALYRLVR